jgi:hypothetical protein|tara:strand:- start:8 stop:469 length:462 start_codon:yes stop_codon:yes gene_type:complete
MALDVKIKTNAKALSKNIGKFQSRLTRAIDKGVKQAGFQLVDIIRTKTAKGVDFRDSSFASYSPNYIKQLQREGKPLKVDLFYSGRMLGSLSSKKTGKFKASVGFTNAQMRQRALFNQVLNEPKREFFGFNDRTENIISKQFNRFVKKELERI